MSAPADLDLRPFASDADRAACVALQREVWGGDFDELVPPSVLKVLVEVSGLAAGAFAPDGTLVGFVVGFAGSRHGRPAHWSHMLAVSPVSRDRGLGVALKAYQRRRLLEQGVGHAYWTYDPLVARNAHVNLNRLGARVERYVRDFYASQGSPLFSGIGTDRFVVEWPLADPAVERAMAGEPAGFGAAARWAEAPVVGRPEDRDPPPPTGPLVRLEIPADIHALKEADPVAGAAWRRASRAAFEACLAAGYRVVGFARQAADGAAPRHSGGGLRCFYLLEAGP